MLVIGVLAATGVRANGIGENGSWQFESAQDKAQKAANVDLMERKKGGYYDSFKTTIINNSTTNIERQVNCNLSAFTTANTGDNSMAANPSSPVITSSGSNTATSTGNSASNALNTGAAPLGDGGGALNNEQSNSGTQSSGVTGSQASSSVGTVSAGGGSAQQSMTSTQSNSGTLSSSVSGSTACGGPIFGTLN